MRASTLLALSWMLVASNAFAANLDAKEREAKKACLNGDAATGVLILTDLYVDTNDPTYIFNQGRCFEQSNRYEDAIARFREYVRKVGSKDKQDVATARKHIADCQALLAEKKGAKVAEAPAAAPAAVTTTAAQAPAPAPVLQSLQGATFLATTPPAPAPTDPSLVAAEPVSRLAPQPSEPFATPGSGLRTLGAVTTAVGGAAVVAGVVFNLKANSLVGELTPNYDRGKASSSQTYKTLSMVGYGAGAACIAGGAILYYLGWRAGSQARTAFLPAVTDDGAGVFLAGAF
jgi:hypothetical protein